METDEFSHIIEENNFLVNMEDRAAKVLCLLTFMAGFALGYKAKEWRIMWIKRRRDRLASQLREAQKELELLQKAH